MPEINVEYSYLLQVVDSDGLTLDHYPDDHTAGFTHFPDKDEQSTLWRDGADNIVANYLACSEHMIEIVDEEYDDEHQTYRADIQFDVTTSDNGLALITVWVSE